MADPNPQLDRVELPHSYVYPDNISPPGNHYGIGNSSRFIPGMGTAVYADPGTEHMLTELDKLNQHYKARNSDNRKATLVELETHLKIHSALRPGVPTAARNNLMTLLQFIETKWTRIAVHYPLAVSYYGQYPYFVLGDLISQRQVDALQDLALDAPKIFAAPLLQAYKAAQELKVEYESIRALLEYAPNLTHQTDVDEAHFQASHEAGWINSLEYRLFVMEQQKRYAIMLLPPFLQQEILSDPNVAQAQSLVESLQSLRVTLDQHAQLYRSRVRAFPQRNPNIAAPLTSPEVDALKWLVADQALNLRSASWKQYHNTLLQQESARYLNELSTYLSSLQIRAEDFTNAHKAALNNRRTRQRQEATAAHLERIRNVLQNPGALNVTTPLSTPGVATVFVNHSANTTAITVADLAEAIGRAAKHFGKIALIETLLRTPALLIGTLALSWPSSLANGERRANATLPLAELANPQDLDAVAEASPGQRIELPYAVNVRTTNQGADIELIQALPGRPIQASVVDLQFNEALGHYEVLIESPERLITVTPAVTPEAPSTELPIVQLGPTMIEGAQITLHEHARPAPAGYPVQDVEAFILRFPTHTGLPPVYLSLGNPYGGTTRGKYSGRMYDPKRSGGPIEELDWRDAMITADGVALVKLHTGRFGPSAENDIMISRLDDILSGLRVPHDTDRRFYTHELRELQRYRNLGSSDHFNDTDLWNHAHTATLEDYQLPDDETLLYSREALEAANNKS